MLQDIIAAGKLSVSGSGPFMYELQGPTSLLAELSTSSDGRLFAFFVVAPASEFEARKDMYNAMLSSFKTYDVKG